MFHRPKKHSNIPKEHRRDFHFTITGHSLMTVKWIALCMVFLFFVQHYLWGLGFKPTTFVEYIWYLLSVLWITGSIPISLAICGLLSFRHPHDLDHEPHNDIPVVWRVVSRGINPEALSLTVRRVQEEMEKTPLFPYLIEIVVDNPIDYIQEGHDIKITVVPKDYQTPNGTRFKARALHYATFYSDIPDWAWIVHLDEETHPTSSGIKGIARMIREENDKEKPRIGQGALLYHRNWDNNHFMFCADMIRTGDDFSRFYFQHKMVGQIIFGLHGSFIVVRNDVERESGGFDFGPDGDITEDATWGLYMMEKGYRSRWVEGYLEEQPPQNIFDLWKQRKRWWSGLWDTCTKTKVSWRWKGVLWFNIMAWACAPFAALYTFGHFFWGTEVHPFITILANFIYATYFTMYMVGLIANIREGLKGVNIWMKGYLICLQSVLCILPILNTVEAVPIFWALFAKDKGFHVIKK